MSIRVESLRFSRGTRRILEQIDFEAADGTVTALLGANGAGKTTLLRCILGLNAADAGEILLDNEPLRSLTGKRLAEHVAFLPQKNSRDLSLSVEDMVLMGTAHALTPFSSPRSAELAAAQAAMEQLDIAHLAQREFAKISGGEQRLVLVARALAQGARTLIFDEPTAGLDYGNQASVLSQARRLAGRGYCVLLSTHDPQHALWYADRVLALKNGRVLGFGIPGEIITPESLYALYGIEAEVFDSVHGRLVVPKHKEVHGGC